jgi:hypothetical protein
MNNKEIATEDKRDVIITEAERWNAVHNGSLHLDDIRDLYEQSVVWQGYSRDLLTHGMPSLITAGQR